MELIGGIWLLDILNILKYEGVDIFDSVVRIDPGTWCLLFVVIIIIAIGYVCLESYFD